MIASIVGLRLPKTLRSSAHSLLVSRASAAVSSRLTSGRTTRLASDWSYYSERTDEGTPTVYWSSRPGCEVPRPLALE